MSYNSPIERKILAIGDELYKYIRSSSNEIYCDNENLSSYKKIEYIHSYALKLLQDLDDLPLEILKLGEKEAREARKHAKEETKTALIKQKRYDLMKKQMKHQFSKAKQFTRVSVSVWRKPQENNSGNK